MKDYLLYEGGFDKEEEKVEKGRVGRYFKGCMGAQVKRRILFDQLLLVLLQMPQAGGNLALLLNSTTAINYPLS